MKLKPAHFIECYLIILFYDVQVENTKKNYIYFLYNIICYLLKITLTILSYSRWSKMDDEGFSISSCSAHPLYSADIEARILEVYSGLVMISFLVCQLSRLVYRTFVACQMY